MENLSERKLKLDRTINKNNRKFGINRGMYTQDSINYINLFDTPNSRLARRIKMGKTNIKITNNDIL